MFKIVGMYQDNDSEVLDETEEFDEATELQMEYQMAYGADWEIWIEDTNRYSRPGARPLF